jgi:hypothetical protein
MFKFQLINRRLGTLVIGHDDPVDINSLSQKVKRSEDNDGVMYEIIIDQEFIKAGRDFIKLAYETDGGIDAQVIVNVYEKDPNTRRWSIYSTGQVNYNRYSLTEDRAIVTIEQTGFERKVLNLLERDVDLETTVSENGTTIPATPFVIDMVYHSKTLLKEFLASPTDESEYQQLNVLGEGYPFCATPLGCDRSFDQTAFAQLDLGDVQVGELEDTFTTGYGYSQTDKFPVFIAKEEGDVDADIKLTYKHSVTSNRTGGDIDFCGDSDIGSKEVKAWLEHQDKDGNVISLTQIGSDWASNVGCGSTGAVGTFETKLYALSGISCAIDDQFFVYCTFRIYGTYSQSFSGASGNINFNLTIEPDKENTYVKFTQSSIFIPTRSKTVLIFEAIQKCCQYITSQADCFRSSLLSRSDVVLPDGTSPYTGGDAGMFGITNGKNLRGLPSPLIASLKDLIDFVNAGWCVGFGFETIAGKQYLVIEQKDHFFNKNSRILSLGKVYDIKRTVDPKRFYNQIEVGFNSKIDIRQTNSNDEFNTVRRFSIPVSNTKNTLKVSTKMRGAGAELEYQRRLTPTTQDSKLDDENFVVWVDRLFSIYFTMRDPFVTIENLYDPASAYNVILQPARMLKNWYKVIASSIIRSTDKVIKFAYGELNYKMTSRFLLETVAVSENGDYDLTEVEPLWDNEIYSFECPFSRNDMKLIKQNPYGYIEFEDRFGNILEGYVLEIDHEASKGTASIQLLKVYRKVLN